MKHGTYAPYSRGCRCEPCVAWNRDRVRRQDRREKYRSGLYSFVHGLSGYDMYGCRCGTCCAAYQEKYRQAQLPTANAARRGLPWTPREIEVAARSDLTAQQVAAKLGRTFTAVKSIRSSIARGKLRLE